MTPTRRRFAQGAAAAMAATAFPQFPSAVFAAPAGDQSVVLARANSIVLSARETHVVLAPVPIRRRPPPKARPKGAKSASRRMQLVLRDVIVRDGASAYDVLLVLEGPNVFEASTTKVQLGTLERSRASVSSDASGEKSGGEKETEHKKDGGGKTITVVLDASSAFAQFAKTRGFNIRHLRVVIARSAVKDDQGNTSVPPDPVPPEIGAIELVQS